MPRIGTERMKIKVSLLQPGDKVRFSRETEVVTVIKVERDHMGYDLLYRSAEGELRWRGFDEGDRISLVETSND